MKFLKKITMFRVYVATVILSLSAYGYAEYYGYELLGSDEENQSVRSHGSSSTRVHHK